MQTQISYQESLEILDALPIMPKGYEKVLFSQALGRILAQDILAPKNMPEFPTSAMDGYALNSKDFPLLTQGGVKIGGYNKAGEDREFVCAQGECIKTFTGARMPQNTDALILVEHTFIQDDKIFLSPDAPKPSEGKWIRKVGENYQQGEVLLKQGSKITPFEIGLLAELNQVFVCVYTQPKVAILSGGDEIIEVGEIPRENAIYSVNNHLLHSLCQTLGAQPLIFPLLRDDKKQIEQQIHEALKSCDILITTGGASRGDFDYTQEVLKSMCDMRFKGVRMKPGKPVGFGVYGRNQYVFGLPGFPNSCAVTFMLFVRGIIARLMGMQAQLPVLKAKLCENIQRADQRMEFRICNLRIKNGIYEVGFWDKKTLQSSVVNNFCSNSALMVLEENGEDKQEGDFVDILLLDTLIRL